MASSIEWPVPRTRTCCPRTRAQRTRSRISSSLAGREGPGRSGASTWLHRSRGIRRSHRPGEASRGRTLELHTLEHLAGGALTGVDSAAHRAVRVDARLRAGPVDAPDRLAQSGAERGERAGRRERVVAAARPGIVGPVLLVDLDRAARAVAEQARQRVD